MTHSPSQWQLHHAVSLALSALGSTHLFVQSQKLVQEGQAADSRGKKTDLGKCDIYEEGSKPFNTSADLQSAHSACLDRLV